MKQRKKEMFKKTLLTLAIAGATVVSAQAATIYTTAVDGVSADVTGLDLVATGTTDDAANAQCVALGADGSDDTTAEQATPAIDDTLNAANVVGLYVASTFAVDDGSADNCDVTFKTTTTTTAEVHGIEYASVNDVVITPSIVAGIGGYKDEDTITINITGAKINLAKTTAPTLAVRGVDGTSTGVANVSFTVLDVSANQVRFTLQATDALNDFIVGGAIIDLGAVILDSSELTTATEVTMESFATNTSGTVFDPAPARVIAKLAPQYTSAVTVGYNERIDVGSDRQEFAGGTADSMTFTTKINPTGGSVLVPDENTLVLTGDFSWLSDDDIDANENGALTTAELASAVKYQPNNTTSTDDDTVKSISVNATFDELTIVTTVINGVDPEASIELDVPGYDGTLDNPVIAEQSFTFASTVADDSTTAVDMVATTATGAGSWTLNGSVIEVPYLPFGPNTQPILRHTNTGSVTGDVTVRYMVEGVHTEGWESLDLTIADVTPGVRNILDDVTDALKAKGYDREAGGFKVALEIVTNVPDGKAWVYAAARVDAANQDRLTVGAFQ